MGLELQKISGGETAYKEEEQRRKPSDQVTTDLSVPVKEEREGGLGRKSLRQQGSSKKILTRPVRTP